MTKRPRNRPIPQPAKVQRWRRTIAAVAALAFLFQGYIVQTHIHSPASSLRLASIARSADATHSVQSTGQKGDADKDDPAHCPFCQELLHAGSYVTPIATIALIPPEHYRPAERIAGSLAVQSVSHAWRGRAPPIV